VRSRWFTDIRSQIGTAAHKKATHEFCGKDDLIPKRPETQRLRTLLLDPEITIRVDDAIIQTREILESSGEPTDPVVRLGWTERGKHKFEVIITEEGIANAEIEETSAEVEDHEGNAVTVEFLKDGSLVQI
jgi:hypothetical protein